MALARLMIAQRTAFTRARRLGENPRAITEVQAGSATESGNDLSSQITIRMAGRRSYRSGGTKNGTSPQRR